jgi:hypothetical protein
MVVQEVHESRRAVTMSQASMRLALRAYQSPREPCLSDQWEGTLRERKSCGESAGAGSLSSHFVDSPRSSLHPAEFKWQQARYVRWE